MNRYPPRRICVAKSWAGARLKPGNSLRSSFPLKFTFRRHRLVAKRRCCATKSRTLSIFALAMWKTAAIRATETVEDLSYASKMEIQGFDMNPTNDTKKNINIFDQIFQNFEMRLHRIYCRINQIHGKVLQNFIKKLISSYLVCVIWNCFRRGGKVWPLSRDLLECGEEHWLDFETNRFSNGKRPKGGRSGMLVKMRGRERVQYQRVVPLL